MAVNVRDYYFDLVTTTLTARIAPWCNLYSTENPTTLIHGPLRPQFFFFCVSPLTVCLPLHIRSQEDVCLIDSITFWRRLTFCQPELAEVKLRFVREAAKDKDIALQILYCS